MSILWKNATPASRRRTREVPVGPLRIGGANPVLIQSMTVSDTLDTERVTAEVRELVVAGCPLVRLTAPSVKHAENLREIRRRLEADGIRVPMVADIHFTPNAALVAAGIVEKIRINPGNYADKKSFSVREYTDRQYREELERVAERFRPLVRALKEHGTALRIGTNHGSLSDRILNRYGDTPEGMVESALEFVRICEEDGFHDIVLSMKSSVPSVMISAYRLLVRRMDQEGMDYPLHLGVTEAGDGLEGRTKSAVGIGSLLADGIGDTIRVSLTEDSRHEIPAARSILEAVARETGDLPIGTTVTTDTAPAARRGEPPLGDGRQPIHASADHLQPSPSIQGRRGSSPWTLAGLVIGGDAPVRVEARVHPRDDCRPSDVERAELISVRASDLVDPAAPGASAILVQQIEEIRARIGTSAFMAKEGSAAGDDAPSSKQGTGRPLLLEWSLRGPSEIHLLEAVLPAVDAVGIELHGMGSGPPPLAGEDRIRLLARLLRRRGRPGRWRLGPGLERVPETARILSDLCRSEGLQEVGFVCSPGPAVIPRTRAVAAALHDRGDLIFLEATGSGPDPAVVVGSLLLDGIGDAILLDGSGYPWPAAARTWSDDPTDRAFVILQACRLRLTKAEFIACPSCGRTQFDLQTVTARIRARTEHLRGVKIAVMGCIVNGPGEMADADFGYVGSGPGKIDLYVGRQRVYAGIPEAEAPDRLVELIREHGRWREPPKASPGP